MKSVGVVLHTSNIENKMKWVKKIFKRAYNNYLKINSSCVQAQGLYSINDVNVKCDTGYTYRYYKNKNIFIIIRRVLGYEII